MVSTYMEKIKLEQYSPDVGTYEIYVPDGFLINDEDGVVNITSRDGSVNLTVSSYTADIPPDEKVLKEFFSELTNEYEQINEFKIQTAKYLRCEQLFFKDEQYWNWWIIVNNNQIIAASINSNTMLSGDEYGLYEFIIDKLEINSNRV